MTLKRVNTLLTRKLNLNKFLVKTRVSALVFIYLHTSMKSNYLIFTLLFSIQSFAQDTDSAFQLQQGDLLFQDLNCGKFCDSIDNVTYGYNNTYVSHVAMVINVEPTEPQLIQAVGSGVGTISLAQFLATSHDSNNKPRVMVGRLKSPYQTLIPQAIIYSQQQIGKPYNDSFIPAHGKAFYCSELVAEAFKYSNHGIALFQTRPMNFMDKNNQQVLPLWQDYYSKLGISVPQGIAGTNPGAMSQESMIDIVYFYGQLRQHSN